MCKDLQNIIESEELTLDNEKLTKYSDKNLNIDKILKLIDDVKDELADKANNNDDLNIIYKFAETLKSRLK